VFVLGLHDLKPQMGRPKKYEYCYIRWALPPLELRLRCCKVSRMGKSVVLIEPYRSHWWLTHWGLGQTDIGNKQAWEFPGSSMKNIKKYYDDPENWKMGEKDRNISMGGQTVRGGGAKPCGDAFELLAALLYIKDRWTRRKIKNGLQMKVNRDRGKKSKWEK